MIDPLYLCLLPAAPTDKGNGKNAANELDKKVYLPLPENELPWIEKTEERPRRPQRAQPQDTGLPLPLGAGRVVAYSAGSGLERGAEGPDPRVQ
jgi:hypothetical protein